MQEKHYPENLIVRVAIFWLVYAAVALVSVQDLNFEG
jgi:hypothetical protein